MAIFHRKMLRGILNLSKCSTIPALHFLLGELPLEGKIHRDVFSLFFCIWRNPDSKIYAILKYLLETSSENSRTWAIHLRHISLKYGLPDPSECLTKDPPLKSSYKEHIQTKICAYYENCLRMKAENNSSMLYLNVSLTGLRGKRHPALSNIITTYEVKKARIHIKMLVGDYLTYETKANQSGGSPHCRCCPDPNQPIIEDLKHILVVCGAYLDIRTRMLPEFYDVCSKSKSKLNFDKIMESQETLCQFILDPASFNLKERIHMSDPVLDQLYMLSRDYCFAVSSARMSNLKTKEQNK